MPLRLVQNSRTLDAPDAPAGVAKPHAKVDVLAVQAEALVETVQRLECLRTDEQEGTD